MVVNLWAKLLRAVYLSLCLAVLTPNFLVFGLFAAAPVVNLEQHGGDAQQPQCDFLAECCGGFSGNTLVKVPSGYQCIRELAVNDHVICLNSKGELCEQQIVSKESFIAPWVFCFKVVCNGKHSEKLTVASSQKFFWPCNASRGSSFWVEAQSVGMAVTFNAHKRLTYLERKWRVDTKSRVYSIRLANAHNFLVTQQDVVVRVGLLEY